MERELKKNETKLIYMAVMGAGWRKEVGIVRQGWRAAGEL